LVWMSHGGAAGAREHERKRRNDADGMMHKSTLLKGFFEVLCSRLKMGIVWTAWSCMRQMRGLRQRRAS
jgi:hypothetical protein